MDPTQQTPPQNPVQPNNTQQQPAAVPQPPAAAPQPPAAVPQPPVAEALAAQQAPGSLPPKKSSRTSTKILAGAIAVVSIAVVSLLGYYVLSQTAQSTKAKPTQSVQQEVLPTPTTAVVKTEEQETEEIDLGDVTKDLNDVSADINGL